MVDLASSSGEEDFFADTSRDEELDKKLFGDLNRDILGPPGDGKVIILSDSDDEDEAHEDAAVNAEAAPPSAVNSPVTPASASDADETPDGVQDETPCPFVCGCAADEGWWSMPKSTQHFENFAPLN
jgi:hypothetical protein